MPQSLSKKPINDRDQVGAAGEKNTFSAPTIALPKGGGAIRGIGEKFAANPVTGTGSMTVPIATSPGRSGFGPLLSLSYDSGSGNGPFGFGWSLSGSSITRKTDKGLPQYRDAEDSDVFILSGAEDLVPMLDAAGQPVVDVGSVPGYRIQRYRPRIEGGFARIERWNRQADGDVHWRILSPNNVLAVFGKDANSRISDPTDPRRAFSWLLCETQDDRGNAVIYEYKLEDATGVDVTGPHERCRGDANSLIRTANRYLKHIRYGNRVPLLDNAGHRPIELTALELQNVRWMFEVVFDYGEHSPVDPRPGDTGAWLCRNDPFSSYRADFEVRTYRLCQRVLMFHHFPDEPGIGQDCLVRSTDFAYREMRGIPTDRQRGHPIASFIASVAQSGYIRANGGGYTHQSLPSLAFEYSQATISSQVQQLDPDSLENLPVGLDGLAYRWVDLNGEGLAGILTEQADAWFYKPNLGKGRLGPLQRVATRPSLANLNRSRQQLMDLAGDGQIVLVQFDRQPAGFYERSSEDGWDNFVPFIALPNVDWANPNLQLVDLTGDGHADLLITEDNAFTWYPSLAEAGFGPAQRLSQPFDEERAPRLVLADGTQTIFLADMSGDGLTDLVRIRNGEVCYWPNVAYGRFGAKVTMSSAPWFDRPDKFDPRRIRLADIDGSGVIDILYLGADEIQFWFNQSGNSWSALQRLADFPHLDNLSNVQVVDLLGNGTACVVWSSSLPADERSPLRYIDLMGGTKPHLLVKVTNNLGAETRIRYAPSTKFYLSDRQAGKPWITRLPFPVYVVEQVEQIDQISRTRFVSRYAYHHGYFDGVEREFRGFAMVEQQDTEAFEDYVVGVKHMEGTQELAPELYQPPVSTRTWFHTGAYLDGDRILHQLRDEYYLQQQHIPEPVLPSGMNVQEMRECVRALKGAPLRQEVYSFDGSPQSQHPYSVAENNYDVKRLQPRVGQRHAVFFTYGCETVTNYYERNPADPRIAHSFNLEISPYGNVLKSASVVYGRQAVDPALPSEVTRDQKQMHITYSEIDYTPDIDRLNPFPVYRLGASYESRGYEITGVAPAAGLFTLAELKGKIALAAGIDYEVVANGTSAQKRLLSKSCTLFRDNTLAPMPLGQWDRLGLGYEGYRMAFTPGVTSAYYAGKLTDADFTAAGYVHFNGDTNWWIPSGTAVYPNNPADHFYIPTGAKDPLGMETVTTLDQYDLLPERVRVRQAAWSEVRATNDYRVLGAVMIIDPNKNRSAVEIDALGLVVKSAVMGKAGASEGDTLADPTVRLEYELFNWMTNGKPNFAHVFAREQHGAGNPRWQESYAYSNGSGGIAMVKAQAHPGKALQVNPDDTMTEGDADPRWVGNGRTILNNKGNPIKRYEPFFSTTHEYEDEKALREIGVTPILYYDAAGRNIRTEFPNGTFAKVEFDPWMQKVSDANDTVKESQWYSDRGSPDPLTQPEPLNNPERRAAWLAAKHADTPGTVHFDSLGRPVYAISDYGGGKTAAVRSESDLAGRFSKMFDQKQREIASGFTGMAGTPIYGASAEKSRRWTFLNVLGGLVTTWDENGREFRAQYDELHRPVSAFVQEAGQAEILFNYVVYGDRVPNAEQLNLLGIAHQIFDQAGMARVPELDFKGNPKSAERILAKNYKNNLNWSALNTQQDYTALQTAANPALEIGEVFTTSSTFDALNRPTRVTLPDGTVMLPTYNEANFLASLRAQIGGQGAFTDFLKDQDYDAKGQRQFAHFGNEVFTRYFYDPKTFRLTSLLTYKSGDDPITQGLQNLHYTYDPVSNIIHIRDDAQQTHYFQNAVVKPESLYEYDAIYQLIRATGREHAGLTNSGIRDDRDIDFAPQLPHVNNTTAVRTYTELYEYDPLGNILKMQHVTPGGTGNWTCRYHYAYEEESTNRTNRLMATSRPGDPDAGPYTATYGYDAYGNITRMPHLADMAWNFMDQLRQVDLGGGGTAYYVYGAGGQRIRKVIERQGNTRVERIYLGAVEIYRERQGNNAPNLERQTLHISDNTGRIAQVDTKTKDDNNSDPANPLNTLLVRYQYGNHLGSAVLETDAGGTVISYEEYHPFGTTAYRSGKPGVDLSLKRYRYSGKERDDETGLYYFGARYYAAWLGRWTSSDPVGFVDRSNLFRYCGNNPVMLSDPSGTQQRYLPGTEGNRLTPQSTLEEREAFAEQYGRRVVDPHSEQQRWVGTPQRGHWELSPEGRFEQLPQETITFEDDTIVVPRPSATGGTANTPGEIPSGSPAGSPTGSPAGTPGGSPSGSQQGESSREGGSSEGERSFFTSSFFKGLAVGLLVAVAVVAVVATGGAALAVIAPAASAAIAASGVGTALAVAGGAVAAANIVQSVRQRDLFNNRISEEQANFNLGFGVGSAAGGALARPISGAFSPGGQALGQRVAQGIENMSSPGMFALPGGGTFGGAIATSGAAGVTTTSAVAAAGPALGTNVLMMSGNGGDGWDDEGWSSGKAKGKTFRGGGKGTRDNWYGYDRDKDFVKWWHRQGKTEFGGNDIENAAEAKNIYDHWVSIGKPVPK